MKVPVSLGDDGRKMVNLPVHNGRNRDLLACFPVHEPVGEITLSRESRDFSERHSFRAGAYPVYKGGLSGCGVMGKQEVLERHGTAKISDTRIVLHHPKPFFCPGNPFRCWPRYRTLTDLL